MCRIFYYLKIPFLSAIFSIQKFSAKKILPDAFGKITEDIEKNFAIRVSSKKFDTSWINATFGENWEILDVSQDKNSNFSLIMPADERREFPFFSLAMDRVTKISIIF